MKVTNIDRQKGPKKVVDIDFAYRINGKRQRTEGLYKVSEFSGGNTPQEKRKNNLKRLQYKRKTRAGQVYST